MQSENEQKSTDGGRLEKLKSTSGKKWTEIASLLGISRSMLFSVVAGKKRLGRDNLVRLAELESNQSPVGVPSSTPLVHPDQDQVDSSDDRSGEIERNKLLRNENADLRERLSACERKNDELLTIIKNLTTPQSGNGVGRALGVDVPIARAGGTKRPA